MSHVTIAASERAAIELFNGIRDKFKWSDANSASWGPFTASYELAMHLDGGTFSLNSDGTATVSELDIIWDKFKFGAGINLPDDWCVGGWCIVPTPWGCAVRLPKWCPFDGNPDIGPILDLSNVIRSEVSAKFAPVVKYRVDPTRPAGMSMIDAEDAGKSDKWQLFLDPIWIDVDPFDVADIIGDLLENAVKAAIDHLLWFLPDFVKDLMWAIIGPVIDLIRWLLDIPDDIQEWLSNLLGVSFGLLNAILTVVADHFAAQFPLFELENPYPVMDYSGVLVPVKIPVEDVKVTIGDTELLLLANVG